MEIVPQQSRIVVEVIEDAIFGHIVMPETMEKPDYQRLRVIAIGSGRTLENGTVVEVPLKVGDEVVVDIRFAARLEPVGLYGNRKLAVIDYAGVLCTVKREPHEPVWTFPKQEVIPPPPRRIPGASELITQ